MHLWHGFGNGAELGLTTLQYEKNPPPQKKGGGGVKMTRIQICTESSTGLTYPKIRTSVSTSLDIDDLAGAEANTQLLLNPPTIHLFHPWIRREYALENQ